jgi:hypothetical protein
MRAAGATIAATCKCRSLALAAAPTLRRRGAHAGRSRYALARRLLLVHTRHRYALLWHCVSDAKHRHGAAHHALSGARVHMCTAGFLLLVAATTWLYVAWPPWPAMIMFGVAFSVEPAALWPCVPILVPSRLSGFAFGVLSSGINISLSIMYPLLGAIAGNHGGDLIAGIALSFLGMALCVAWHRRELQHFDNRCNQPPSRVSM